MLAVSHTSTDAITAMLLDMSAAGVTDIVGETPFNMFVDVEIPTVEAQKPVAQPVVTPKATPKPVVAKPTVDLSAQVWMVNEGAKVICAATGIKNGEAPFSGEEQMLFTNMLKAIGLSPEDVGYLVVHEKHCTEENGDELSTMSRRMLSSCKANVIMSFGENMCPVLMGGKVTLSGVRGFGKEVAGIRYVATYSPRSLLKQPLLKRLAWEDLQIAQGYMKVVADA